VIGGSVGRGTAIEGEADAEVVFFLTGLPDAGRGRWLPPLLQAAASGFQEHLSGSAAPGLDARVADSDGAVRVTSEQDKVDFAHMFAHVLAESPDTLLLFQGMFQSLLPEHSPDRHTIQLQASPPQTNLHAHSY